MPKTEMAVYDPAKVLTLPSIHHDIWRIREESGKDAVVTNMPFDTPEALALIASCDQPGALKLRKMEGETIEIVGFRCKPVEYQLLEGELINLTHTVLLGSKPGVRYETIGSGVAKSVGYLIVAYGMRLWRPPIKVRVVGTSTGKPNPFLQLEVVS